MLQVFRLNGRLLDVADRITEGTPLTAARWQVLGAVLPGARPVAGIARNMGLARQSVQRLADVLVEEGVCEYRSNPAHRRAKLLVPTAKGRGAIERIHPIQVDWADRVGAELGLSELRRVNALIGRLLATLESTTGAVRRAPGRTRKRKRRRRRSQSQNSGSRRQAFANAASAR
ncbi:MAG TPA: MarR family winged helix-turn-helix transcriptional regulator [Polyangiaceae bacterium]